jgi:hypothetical protein
MAAAMPGCSTHRVAGLVVLLFWLANGQTASAPDPFARIAFLIGRWEGTSEGQPGQGTVRREYARVMNARFIHLHNRNEYPPQPSRSTLARGSSA